ncbi:pyruvate, phosphate dikinase [Aciditerrimonas ferrireducens]|uniref:pyruvate, phosphate dikinase n=1 Tax=Aciditerrimonas ferrireducens TaxID=667306 RepID=UPI002005B907|nr:pyruvate, phosphate dikinase [Aciditerrimonas ferrireducens]MCK4176486.1 pyruvate, phosphate dikinase [Aciditerrimonas ferrireducens]
MGYVFDFDHRHERPPMELKDLLGGKGANLAEMTSVLGLPVPPGFTISTEACRAYLTAGWPAGLDEEVAAARARLEERMGKRLGDPEDPLLVSVRSGAKFSMPGMMDTVLNLGLNDRSVAGLAKQTGDERFAYDSYRRFLAMYGRIVLEIPGEEFDRLLEAAKELAGTDADAGVPVVLLRFLCDSYKAIVERATGRPFPQDPDEQLRGAIEAVFRSWNGPRARAYREHEGIPHDLGTAVNVQAMVFGNRDDRSGTGVGFTRDPNTGAQGEYGDFLVNAQGEDVVAGIRNTLPLSALAELFPEVHAELLEIFARLERHYRDMCDTEFTIEQGKLWMLQTRVGKRTGRAALRMAVDMTSDPAIALSRAEAIQRITEDHVEQVLHPQFATQDLEVLTTGLAASPGAAVGRAYFSADDAEAAAARGEPVILVRTETSPEDVHGMLAAQGILTARGGLVSHAAVVARGWGKPAVVGADALRISGRRMEVGGTVVEEGDWLSIDGSSGQVVLGQVPLTAAEPPPELQTILGWADELRAGHLAVRANADNGPDARNARRLGAEGIGLCRTEHMFLGEDRLPVVRRMILAETEEEERAALEELRAVQREDFRAILEEMDGLPVTVRLLDPPLHEFLPDVAELELKRATEGLSDEEERLYGAAKAWREFNPMLGVRGVRLGVLKPGLYSMQVRALMEAAADRVAAGGRPVVEIMIPLTVAKAELAEARRWVEEALAEAGAGGLEVRIGTMIETPRAALRAGEIAEVAEFFSFGTNDLTQLTFGFSRDDVEGRMMSAYLAKGLLPANPFETVDPEGVGELVRLACERGRAHRPDLKLGVCGEHGGDPASIEVFAGAGVDYVSCSPFRVPVARLAAAQALLALGVVKDEGPAGVPA